MHKVSRSLLFAGVLAFGTLTAACGSDTIVPTTTSTIVGVTSVLVSPPSASIPVGTSIALSASVSADATTAKTVTWSTSNAAVATVDATGKVTGISAGVVTIIATATADPSKSSASAITVTAVTVIIPVPPSIDISTVIQGIGSPGAGLPVNLSNVAGQIDITVNTSGGGLIEVFLSSNCTTNTIASTDVAVASQQATSAQAGAVTLSVNTAQLTAANAPRFPNGNYCIKARLTNGTTTVVATNTTPLTLNNTNVFKLSTALCYTSQTGRAAVGGCAPTVVGANGLAYNEGTLTATIAPVIFSTTTPVASISGYLTRLGEQAGGASPGTAVFTNIAVTGGVATIAFTDTGSVAGVRSIWQYTSLPLVPDTLVITSAIDAAGNQITVTNNPGTATGNFWVARDIRIDNDIPVLPGAFTVTAPNGYIGAAYLFSSGTTGAAAADTRGGVQGVNTVTVQYFVGPAGGTIFNGTPATLCSVTGLTLATVGTDLANTNAITVDQAKLVVKDALGNQVCAIVPVTTVTGSPVTFGVDKIAPIVLMVPPTPAGAPTGFSNNNGAAANTGYAVTKNWSFVWQDTISQFTNGVVLTPLKGTLTKNFFTAGTSAAADCVIGTYAATPKTCSAVVITPTTSVTAGPGNVSPWNVNSIEFTNGTAINGYWTFTGTVTDLAGNVSASVTRLAAFDNVAPAIGALTQSPAALAPLATVTVTGTATDNVDLTSSKGRLAYATAFNAIPFQSVTGTSFGPNFDATVVTSAPASVALPNVYRGMQTVDGTNTILAGGVVPTGTITVTDVGGNTTTSAPLTIATTTAKADIFVGNTLTGASTVPAPTTSQATTTLAVSVGGLVADPAFQNQPFAQVDFYKLTGGELVLVASNTAPVGQDFGTARTYTYTQSGIALTAAATNTFYAVGRNAAGDAVISNPFTVVNP